MKKQYIPKEKELQDTTKGKVETRTEKKSHYPKEVEYADLNKNESRQYITKQYIEMRISEQKMLTEKEKRTLTPELKLYYNQLEQQINRINKY